MYLDKIFDWKEFELFVKKIYEVDPNLIVEHNVTLVGKSGAKRQIDVLITQKSKLHTYITLVECKKWKKKVDRARVDVMVASIEDLNASKGVIFTTNGYEEGAEKYAASKNIDIFVIRELNDKDWGLPGRIIEFYLQYFVSNAIKFSMPDCKLVPVVEQYPDRLDFNIVIDKDHILNDFFYLYSVKTGDIGAHLISILTDKQNEIMNSISNQIKLLEEGQNGASLLIQSNVEIDFSEFEYRQLRTKYGAININKVLFELITHVSQTVFHTDRGEDLNIALVVENYIRRQKHIVFQKKSQKDLELTDNLLEVNKPSCEEEKALENGSIFKVFLEPWVKISLDGNEKMGTTNIIEIKL